MQPAKEIAGLARQSTAINLRLEQQKLAVDLPWLQLNWGSRLLKRGNLIRFDNVVDGSFRSCVLGIAETGT